MTEWHKKELVAVGILLTALVSIWPNLSLGAIAISTATNLFWNFKV
jgi:hypothetical protein